MKNIDNRSKFDFFDRSRECCIIVTGIFFQSKKRKNTKKNLIKMK